MKLKYSHSYRNIKKKKLSLNTILNSEYLFHRSTKIQMALNHRRVVSKDFYVKIAQPKTDTGKKKKIVYKENNDDLNSYLDYIREFEQKDVPLELTLILRNYQKKFLKESKKFFAIKQYNDRVLNFLKHLNELNKKKERDNLLKKYFPEDDGDNNINLYSDQIQKLAENLFKSNPLLTYNNYSEIFFHYLSEFSKCNDNNKINNIKQKIVKFLNKLKDFVEYVEINNDEDTEGIIKDIKMKNLNYLKEYGNKIKNETIKLKEKINIMDKKSIEESKKMIDETKNTLSDLVENKNLFEDPKNFRLYYSYDFNKIKNKNSRNIYLNKSNIVDTPNRNRLLSSNKNGRLSNTMITGFYLSDKKNSIKKDENKNIFSNENLDHNLKKSQFKKIRYLSKRFSSNVSDINLKTPFIKSYKNRRISAIKNRINFSRNSIDKELNSLRNSLLSSDNNNKMAQSTSQFFKYHRNNKSINFFEPLTNKNKKVKIKSIFSKNRKTSEEKNENTQKDQLNEMKEFTFKKKEEPCLIEIYDDIKNKNKIKKKDIDNIKKYFSFNGKKINPEINPLYIIKAANEITNRLDIEKTTKRVFQPYLSYKQIQKLENIEKINDKMFNLRYDYMSRIFDFKARNSESIHNYI